jgi:nucleoside-diphosphate-sugar epimerase
MPSDVRILITGVNGSVAFPVASALAQHNDVWGLARFTDPTSRHRVESAGIHAVAADISAPGALDELPEFDYVLHLAYYRGGMGDFEEAMRINAEGTGLLLTRFRSARAVLVMSSNVIYPPHDDPWHAHREDEPIGGMIPFWSPTSPTAKVAEEAVARSYARTLDLPVVITRLNSVYGPSGDLQAVMNMDAVVEGRPVSARWDPHPHAPIHVDDIVGQLDAMLDAASTPATIVNWAGDDQVTIQQWSQMAAEWAGTTANVVVNAVPGTTRNNLADTTKRMSITGPCGVRFESGFRAIFEQRHGPVRAGSDTAFE